MNYDQWKDPTDYWSPPSIEDGSPTDDQLLDDAIKAARTTPDETHDAILLLLGLIQSVASSGDCPETIRAALLQDQRYLDARAVAIAYL